MEIEVKVRLNELDSIKNKLIERGASFNEPVVHQDAYFKTKGFEKRVQGPGEFILRIRRVGNKSILTFKALTDILGAWIEHETEIADPDEMEKILLASGFVKAFTLNKSRVIGSLDGFELCIDDVKELGKYMEVGLISDENGTISRGFARPLLDEGGSLEKRARIIAFLKELGFADQDIEKRGYGEIIGEKLGHKFDGMR